MKRLVAGVALFAAGVAVGVAAVPSALDPARVAPHIYEVALENDRVRVLKRTMRNGETMPLVAQPDRVVIYLNPCAWIEDDGAGGERMQDFKFGTPTWQPANTHGGQTSNVIQKCRVIEVELKD